jgi:hypothetical protein
MSHPDLERPYGTRPVVAQLVEVLAEKHRLLVHTVLRGQTPEAIHARADLCHLLIERCWIPDAVDRFFGFPPGTAAAGKAHWKAKLADDEARRIEAEAFAAAGGGLPPIRERMADMERRQELNAERRAQYAAAKEGRRVVVGAPKPRRHRERPLTASIIESALMGHGVASGCTAHVRTGTRNRRGTCGRPVAEGCGGLCGWHAAQGRRVG